MQSYSESNNPEHAIPICQKIMDIDFDDEDAYQTCSGIFDKLNQPEQALKYAMKAFSITPDKIGYVNLAYIYKRLKRYNKALEIYSQAIEKYGTPDLYDARATLFIESLNKYDRAIKDYSSAIEICKKNTKIVGNTDMSSYVYNIGENSDNYYTVKRGLIYSKLIKNQELAILDFSDAINNYKGTNAEISDIYKFRAESYKEINEIEKAKHDISKAIEINPNDAESWYLKGELHDKLNEAELARNSYNQALKYSSNQNESCAAQEKLKNLDTLKK